MEPKSDLSEELTFLAEGPVGTQAWRCGGALDVPACIG